MPDDAVVEPAEGLGRVYLNKEQMAQALRVTVPTFNKYLTDGCPIHRRGGRGVDWQFDPDAVIAWRERQLAEASAQSAAAEQKIAELQAALDLGRDNDVPALSIKAREDYYRAEKLRMDLDRQRGFLTETARVRAEYSRVFKVLSDRLQTLPDYLERRCGLTPAQVAEIVRVVDEWQRELAESLLEERADADAA